MVEQVNSGEAAEALVKHHAEAQVAASVIVLVIRAMEPDWKDAQIVNWVFGQVAFGDVPGLRDHIKVLGAFGADYGMPAVLRVVATALETK